MANNNTELKGWAKYCKEQNIEFSTKRISSTAWAAWLTVCSRLC